jgi:branched-chain amino acid transport system permease protein
VDTALQVVAAGFSNGAVYGISALGIVVVYRVARIVNLAQGEAITIGALASWWLVQEQGWPRAGAAAAAVAGTAVFYGGAAWLTVLRAGRATRGGTGALPATLPASLVTLAFALFAQGLLFAGFGRELYGSPPLVGWGPLRLGGASLPAHTIVVVGVTVVVAGLLTAAVRWTMGGLAMVACAENRSGASVVGVDVARMIVVVFAVAGLLGALAGVLLSPVTVFSYLTGFGFALRGLAAAALVGFRSPGAGLAAGLAVGILEAAVGTYIASGYQESIVAAVLIVTLMVWPRLAPALDSR